MPMLKSVSGMDDAPSRAQDVRADALKFKPAKLGCDALLEGLRTNAVSLGHVHSFHSRRHDQGTL